MRERAGQLCPPVEFGMCPPRASRRPGVKVNKGAIWTASSNPSFHPPSHSPVTGIGLSIQWPRPPVVAHTIAAACRLLCRTQKHSRVDLFWCCQQAFSIFIPYKLQIPELHLAAEMHANNQICREEGKWWTDFPNACL